MPDEQQVATEQLPLDDPKVSMQDYKNARNAGETTVERPVVEEKEEPAEEEKTEEEKPKQKGWNGAQKKIDRLIKHNAELEKRAEAAEREREELRKGKTEEKPKADGEPKEEDFNGDTMAYLKAQARWEVRQELKAQEEAAEKAQMDAETQATFDAHNETLSAARAKYEDFDEALTAAKTPWKDGIKSHVYASQALNVAVVESGNGAEILYYLAHHPEELAKMVDYTPAKVTLAIGRIADKLDTEPEEEEQEEEAPSEESKPKIVSKAPAPIKPVGSSSSKSTVPLDQMSMADYKKARAAGRIK